MFSRCTSFMLYKSLLTMLLISRLKDLQTCARQISSKCARFGHHWSPLSIKYCCWLYHLRIVASDNSSPSTKYYSDTSRLYLEDWFCRGLYFKKLTCTWESMTIAAVIDKGMYTVQEDKFVHLVFWNKESLDVSWEHQLLEINCVLILWWINNLKQ